MTGFTLGIDRFNLITLLLTLPYHPLYTENSSYFVIYVVMATTCIASGFLFPILIGQLSYIMMLRICLSGSVVGLLMYITSTYMWISFIGLTMIAFLRPTFPSLTICIQSTPDSKLFERQMRVKIIARRLADPTAVLISLWLLARHTESAHLISVATAVLYTIDFIATFGLTITVGGCVNHQAFLDYNRQRYIDDVQPTTTTELPDGELPRTPHLNARPGGTATRSVGATEEETLAMNHLGVLVLNMLVYMMTENVLFAHLYYYFKPNIIKAASVVGVNLVIAVIMWWIPLPDVKPTRNRMFIMAEWLSLLVYGLYIGLFHNPTLSTHLALLILPILFSAYISELPYLSAYDYARPRARTAIRIIQISVLMQWIGELFSVFVYVYFASSFVPIVVLSVLTFMLMLAWSRTYAAVESSILINAMVV